MSTIRAFLAAAALSVVTLTPGSSQAAPDQDALRIAAATHSLKWNWTPAGKSDRYGHAETLIKAKSSAVKAAVQEYGKYTTFNPAKFKQSKVVGTTDKGETDVYMQMAAMKGLVKFWTVARFGPAKSVGNGTEVIEGKHQKGNVKDAHVIWTIRTIDENWTFLKCDILMKPDLDIPTPQAAIDEELRDSAMYAVDNIHDRTQGSKGIAAYP